MKYIKVTWHQDDPRFPKIIYSELSKERWEVRKIEVFEDGTLGWANSDTDPLPYLSKKANEIPNESSRVLTFLGEAPFPDDDEIDAEAEFSLENITQEEFEFIWKKAIAISKGR